MYNSKIIGFHNYYQIATHCNLDFRSIAFIVSRALKNNLKLKRNGIATGYIKEKYGNSKQLRFVGSTAVVPIAYIQNRIPLDKKVAINNYTTEGRALIHKSLEGINMNVLHYLMENSSDRQRIEFYNNKIALYSGQKGKCFVTGKPLEIGDMHCHHRIPYSKSKNDKYSNLILVTVDVHRLLHAKNQKTICYYLEKINPNKKQLDKINKLRKMLELEII